MKNKTLPYLFLLLIAGISPTAVGSAPPPKEAPVVRLTLGVVPRLNPERLKAAWTPFLQKVSAEAGLTIEFASAPSIREFHRQVVVSHTYDLVYINPNDYVRSESHYSAFARHAKKKLAGILVKRKGDERIRAVPDLAGKSITLPEGAFAATMINKLVIAQAQIDLQKQIKITELATHEACYESVAAGKADAAGGVNGSFNNLPEATRAKLEIFHTSEGYSPHPFCARKTLPAAVVKKVQQAFVKVSGDPANKELMKSIDLGVLESTTDADYDDLRRFSEVAAMLDIHE